MAKHTALVTGANRGIGLEIARGLAGKPDIRVIAAARSEKAAEEAAEEIGGRTVAAALDLSDLGSVEKVANGLEAEHGSIDILVNNAGVLTHGDGLSVSPGDVLDSMMVNALSPFALIQILGAKMKERGWGRIVNVSSGWGSFNEGLTGPAAYSISKAALNAVTLSFAQALGSKVKCNAACPGWVRTRMGGQGASRSPEKGAETPIWLATLPDNGPTGKFFRDREEIDW